MFALQTHNCLQLQVPGCDFHPNIKCGIFKWGKANVVPLGEQEQEIMMGHTMRLSSCVSIILSSTKTDLLFLNVQPLITSLIWLGDVALTNSPVGLLTCGW